MSSTLTSNEARNPNPDRRDGRHEARGRRHSGVRRRSRQALLRRVWVGGSTPISPSATSFGSSSSRLQARHARSTSARDSRRPRRARHAVLYLIVSDIEAARAELVGRGVDVSEVFHS